MPGTEETWIRQRAHEIWEAQGRPEGRDFDHWCAASEEFRSLKVEAPAVKPARKAPTGKKAEKAGETLVAEAVKAPARKRAAKPATVV